MEPAMGTVRTSRYVLSQFSLSPAICPNGLGDTLPKIFEAWNLTVADNADSAIACCSLGAAVQGMDETAVNGAQLVGPLPEAIFP